MTTDLAEFLAAAKRNTYAKEGEGGEKTTPDGGKVLEFEHGGFRYRDTYYGFNPFAGEEIVWQEGKPVWAMNYYGNVEDEAVAKMPEFYAFLKACLAKVTKDAPYRGPRQHADGPFTYINNWSGDENEFSGSEAISHEGEVAYRLHYHGGKIK